MIGSLKGIVSAARNHTLILEVGGVGYRVTVPEILRTKIGETLALHIHTAVREDALDLYGFETEADLECFEALMTLPGVGPKTALGILDHANPDTIREAVSMEDPDYLTKISGVSKKTAEKIVLGLKGKWLGGDTHSTRRAGLVEDAEAVEALAALGYSQKAVRDVLKALPAELSGTEAKVKAALRQLAK